MKPEDWRTLPKREIAPLLEAEIHAWQKQLGWHVRESWRAIEPARAAGALPGFVVRDAGGRIAGWTCFLEHLGTLQVAVFVAASRDAACVLVDAILASDVAARTTACVWCVRDATPGLAATLTARRCDVTRYHYLSTAIRHPRPAAFSARRLLSGRAGLRDGLANAMKVRRVERAADVRPLQPWRDDDDARVAELCERSYSATDQLRAFAPNGTPDEWRDYVRGLRHTLGCGRFLPDASLVASNGDALEAAMVVTQISPEVAHLAQIVVDPATQRKGWGRRLMEEALRRTGTAGYKRMTLLVADGNKRARALYAGLGFKADAAFVVAVMRQPRRLSSVALASGGESTRRYAASVVPPRSSAATALRRASSASASADSDC